ncbi:MAG: 2Fe-2S iron-sulfur cluster-binding protein [Candidatus Latescibacterota bacterium]
MKTITLTINDMRVTVPGGGTVLDAAESLGITIPTLCHTNGCLPNTSCMVCVVHELRTDSLIPACSMPAAEGMRIATDDERVREARRDTLDLLVSEHVGDCESPCRRACPAHMNIPLMIRQIQEKKFGEALITVRNDIALPAVMGRICPAPCEKACYRSHHDHPLSICALKRFVADLDLAKASPFRPEILSRSGKKVAVVGAGPAGLSAAYFIARYGHECHVYDRNEKPGGMLRYGVPDEKLPKSVLDAEIASIRALEVEFRTGQTLGKDFSLRELREEYAAVVLAWGKTDPDMIPDPGMEISSRGIAVNRKTFETSMPGVFAGGNAVSEGKMAIRSAAHGKAIAFSVHRFVNGLPVNGPAPGFTSVIGKLQAGETEEFIKGAERYDRVEPSDNPEAGFSENEAIRESQRCFHCDCRKPQTCALRRYAAEYGADQKRFSFGRRNCFRRIDRHELVIFEPGKCIKCNRCVEITKKAGEQFGFTFINRGFDIQVAVPFSESLENGLRKAAKECVEACPTAALSWKRGEEEEKKNVEF